MPEGNIRRQRYTMGRKWKKGREMESGEMESVEMEMEMEAVEVEGEKELRSVDSGFPSEQSGSQVGGVETEGTRVEAGGAGAVAGVETGEVRVEAGVEAREEYQRPTELEPGAVIAGRWEVCRKIGQGSFGSVYEARDQDAPADTPHVALKLELRNASCPVLQLEAEVLWLMADSQYAARMLGCGQSDGVNFLAMELLGQSLGHHKRAAPDQLFSISTTVRLAADLILALQQLHDKPANLVTGRGGESSRVVLLDFGLSRRYVSTEDGKLRPFREQKVGFRGTLRYAPLASHRKRDLVWDILCRGDDLCSLLYTISELGTGRLPWRSEHDKKVVEEMKREASGRSLFPAPLPPLLAAIFEDVAGLFWDARPAYDKYAAVLHHHASVHGYFQRPLDWQHS